MPADGDDATTLMMLDDLLSHLGEGHTVQILGVTHLDTTQFEAHHCGPVTTGILHITGVSLIFPCQAIERIVLMTKHITFLLQRLQTLHQLLTLCLLYDSFLSTGCHHRGYTYYIYILLHS